MDYSGAGQCKLNLLKMLLKMCTHQTVVNPMVFSEFLKYLIFVWTYAMLYPALENFHDNTHTQEAKVSHRSNRLLILQVERILNLLSSRSAFFPSHTHYVEDLT